MFQGIVPIVIDGNIGSGKTTALKNLSNHPWVRENMFQVVEENVDEWKPYLAEFYKDMKQNALLFQMKVLQHHMRQSQHVDKEFTKITERSPLSCLHVFGENLHQNNMLSDLDMKLMFDMNRDFGWMPRIVFYINTPANICYERIHIRSRENEIIPMTYLEQIDELYQKLYLDDDNIHIYRPKECYIIDGTNTPEEVLDQILNIMKTQCLTHEFRMSRLSHARSYPSMSSLVSNGDTIYSLPITHRYSHVSTSSDDNTPNRVPSSPISKIRMSSDIREHSNFGYQ
jgi:deoxyadenosine/deoxycytidine kinase